MFDSLKNNLFPIIAALSDSCTFVIAISAFVAYWKNKRKINLLLKFAINKMQQDRLNYVKDTLSRLESLNYDEKEHRTKIMNMFGTLYGQVTADTALAIKCSNVLKDIDSILKKDHTLNEHTKCRIVSEVKGHINNTIYDIETSFMEDGNER